MRIVGIGTEIVECVRIGRMIADHGELFLRRIYTDREIAYCQGRKNATPHFAARWAAKEAIVKAMGTGWADGIDWLDIDVRPAPGGRSLPRLSGAVREAAIDRGLGEILLTTSQCRSYATAYAIALAGDGALGGAAFD